jgi:hypothetical protein
MNSPNTPPADPFAEDLAEGKVFRDIDLRGGITGQAGLLH